MDPQSRNLALILVFFSGIFSVQGSLAEPMGNGPQRISNQFPLSSYRLSLTPETPNIHPGWSIDSSFAWTNTFVLKKYLTVDTETRILQSNIDYGASDSLAFGFSVPLHWMGSGVLDSVIADWHDTLGLPGGNRDKLAQGGFKIRGLTRAGDEFLLPEEGNYLGDVVLSSKYRLFGSGQDTSQLSLRGTLSLPTSMAAEAKSAPDYGIALLGRMGKRSLRQYLSISGIFFGDRSLDTLTLLRSHAGLAYSAEYDVSEHLVVLFGLQYESSLSNDIPLYTNYSLYLDAGIAWRWNRDTTGRFVLRENPGASRETADVSFLFGVQRAFGS